MKAASNKWVQWWKGVFKGRVPLNKLLLIGKKEGNLWVAGWARHSISTYRGFVKIRGNMRRLGLFLPITAPLSIFPAFSRQRLQDFDVSRSSLRFRNPPRQIGGWHHLFISLTASWKPPATPKIHPGRSWAPISLLKASGTATTGSKLPCKPASGHVAPLQRDCVFWEENKPHLPLPSYSTVPGPRADATVFLILNLYSHTSVWKRVEWMIFFFFHQFLPDLCEFLPSGQTVTSSISVFQGRRGGTKTGNHFKSLTVMITRMDGPVW